MKQARSYYCAYSLREKTVRATPDCHTEWGSVPFWGWGGGWGSPSWGATDSRAAPLAICPQREDTVSGQAGTGFHTAQQPREGCTRPSLAAWLEKSTAVLPPSLAAQAPGLGGKFQHLLPIEDTSDPRICPKSPTG